MLNKKSGRLRDGLTDIKYMKKHCSGIYFHPPYFIWIRR